MMLITLALLLRKKIIKVTFVLLLVFQSIYYLLLWKRGFLIFFLWENEIKTNIRGSNVY